MSSEPEQHIETIDTVEFHTLGWPFFRAMTPAFVDKMEAARYLQRLLATGRWQAVRVAPHPDPAHPSYHLLDVFGVAGTDDR